MSIQELLKCVSEITKTKYVIKTFDFLEHEEVLMIALEELLNNYKNLEQSFKDYVKDVDENYKSATKEEQIYG